jgi:hypothetical protein
VDGCVLPALYGAAPETSIFIFIFFRAQLGVTPYIITKMTNAEATKRYRARHNDGRIELQRLYSGIKNRSHYSPEVCQEWLDSPTAFHKWAKLNGWQRDLWIDRIDNEKGYSPDNCRFVTPAESARNRRCVKLSAEKAEAIRDLRRKGYGKRRLSKMFNVSRTTIHYICVGRIWLVIP